MEEQKEIQINKTDFKMVLMAIILPLLLSFILQHIFGEFRSGSRGDTTDGLGWTTTRNTKLSSRTFHTIFGNQIYRNYEDENITLYRHCRYGIAHTSPSYIDRIPFYLKAIYADILYSIVMSLVLIAGYFFRKKYRFKLK